MSDDVDYQKQEALRYRMETSKEKSILIRNWIYTAISLIVAAMLVWALYAWKQTNNVIGATNARFNAMLDKLDTRADAIDDKLNRLLAETTRTIQGVQPIEGELAGAVSDLRYQTSVLSQSLTARLRTVDSLLVSVRGIADEGAHQLKQNGDALASVTLHADSLLADNAPHIDNAMLALERGMNGLATAIETNNPKVAAALDNLNAVIVEADGTIKAYQPVGVNLAGITDDFHKMTSDSQKKLHEILWPAPAHGFWPRTKQIAGYLLRPAFDGLRLYYQIQALPVRITQPIPVAK